MLAEFEDGGTMSDEELRDQLMTLLLAGHETTATALAWTFDLLLRHRAAAAAPARLARGGGGRLPAGDDLRVAAPAPGAAAGGPPPRQGARRRRPHPAGRHRRDAGDLAHPHPRRPLSRALRLPSPSASSRSAPDTYAWIPFGGGIRRCIGASFAEFEMRIVLREVLTRCDLHKASPLPEKTGPPQHHPLAQGRHPGRRHRAASRARARARRCLGGKPLRKIYFRRATRATFCLSVRPSWRR